MATSRRARSSSASWSRCRRCCGRSTKSPHAADFLSVGSNDLMQYLYAVDRDNRRVANRFDPLSVGFLRALRAIAQAGARAGTPVTLCGEIGGRPLEAMALMAIGYRDLSMSATSIGPVKAMTLTAQDRRDRARGRGDAGGGPRRGLAARAAARACRALRSAALAPLAPSPALPFRFPTCPPTTISISSCAATRKSARA